MVGGGALAGSIVLIGCPHWSIGGSSATRLVNSVIELLLWHRWGESDRSGTALAITAAITRPSGYTTVRSNACTQRASAHGPHNRSSSTPRRIVVPPWVLIVAAPLVIVTSPAATAAICSIRSPASSDSTTRA